MKSKRPKLKRLTRPPLKRIRPVLKKASYPTSQSEDEAQEALASLEERLHELKLITAALDDDLEEAPTKGRGKSQKSLDLIDAAYQIAKEIHPCTVRAICYRLFLEKWFKAMGWDDSMAKSNTNSVGKLLTYAREHEMIPWDWIVDETREVEGITTWRDVAEFGDAVKRGYRKNYWAMQPRRIEVWAEKGTIRGTLAPVLNKYGVDFRVMHGHTSTTVIHEVAEDTLDSDKPTTYLYVGDFDPSGMDMSERDLPNRLVKYGGNAKIIRVALTEADAQTLDHRLGFPASDKAGTDDKKGDSRYPWFVASYGDWCFELDALSPVILRKRVEQAIRSQIDRAAWNHAMRIEKAERESMAAVLAKWPGASMPSNPY
jgi:hypothetical protein